MSKIFAVVLLFGSMGINAFGYPIAEEEYFDEEDIALSASTSLEVFSWLDFVQSENARIPGKSNHKF